MRELMFPANKAWGSRRPNERARLSPKVFPPLDLTKPLFFPLSSLHPVDQRRKTSVPQTRRKDCTKVRPRRFKSSIGISTLFCLFSLESRIKIKARPREFLRVIFLSCELHALPIEYFSRPWQVQPSRSSPLPKHKNTLRKKQSLALFNDDLASATHTTTRL